MIEKLIIGLFYRNKRLFNSDDIDVNKIRISKKEPFGKRGLFKYIIGT